MAWRPQRSTSTMDKMRAWRGPDILSYGFRPFFLFAALHALVSMAIFAPWVSGHLVLSAAMSPIQWHVHALLFGYLPGVLSGFLLTAVPNWKGRMPVLGWPLAGLFGLWLAGRLAWYGVGVIGYLPAALIDFLYLPVLFAFLGREIVLGKNWINLKILALLGVMVVANVLFHSDVQVQLPTVLPERLGIAAGLGLMMLIGGRIIPSFTTNWLKAQGHTRMPPAFDVFDYAVVAFSVAALALWVVELLVPVPRYFNTVIMLLAGVMNFVRLGRWRGQYTLDEPLVAALHVAYAFVPLGFILAAGAVWRDDSWLITGALHSWTAGAFGLLTLAVMTRATLGHTGRPLTASLSTVAIYGFVVIAAFLRIAGSIWPLNLEAISITAAIFWCLGFGLFVVVYGPMLIGPRKSR